MTDIQRTSASRLLVIQPDALAGLDHMGVWAREHGVEIDVVMPFVSAVRPESVLEYDGLVVLGGQMGDLDTADYPWLEDIREMFRIAENSGVPSLGVCLGAQLLASSLGGRVAKGEAGLEIGVVEVSQLSAAESDPLLRDLPKTFPVGSMHFDAITELPPDATRLATGQLYPNQVFRQRSCWGVQFHPELGPVSYKSWVEMVAKTAPEKRDELEDTVEEFDTAFDEVKTVAAQLFNNFFEIMRSRTA